MLRTTALLFCLLGTAFLLGCSAYQTNNSNSTAANENKSGATKTTNTATSSTASAEKIGVPECDDFLAKYDACVTGKVPEAARAQYEASLKQWRDSWRK